MLYIRSPEFFCFLTASCTFWPTSPHSPHPQPSVTSILLGFQEFSFFKLHMQVISYSICLTLSDFSHLASCPQAPSMLEQMVGFPSFWWLNNILLYRIIPYLYPLIQLTGCFRVLASVNDTTMNMRMQISLQDPVSFPLDTYPEVRLLNHMIVLFLIFWRTSILFSIVAASIYIPTNSAQGVPFLQILRNTYLLPLWWYPF